MTRPWSLVQVNQWGEHDSKKPRDQTREDEKLRGPSQKSVESCGTRSFIQFEEKLTTRAHMQKGKDIEDSGTNTGRSVTEPPKIVLYYCLSLSTWPLSNNKERFCRFRRVRPGKSHTTGSLICAKPTRRRDQSTTLHHIKVHKFNIFTNQVFRP
jgi:hypothetical protein